ncbi:dTDP-4-dehydrorhamnose reductase family protein [Methanoculleus sp. 7T]|uniref:dTDP-4-dehydrorhamnose reductase family protein n=1 Tax=Methanoculleus sp. 7T TaxID=2937282 RepID=UPI0024A6BB36|nr:SDR family oxidoreductase [Methanoculleus sp. 7T]
MRLLLLGATGMLGHKLLQALSKQFSIWGTVRSDVAEYQNHPVLNLALLKGHINADNISTVEKAIEECKPDVVINCIGIVKQLPAAHDPLQSIAINALFPHQLARICQQRGIRLIHISTDCVFSGRKGNYSEEDFADAGDLYGQTKHLGEVDYENALTLRTSIIGRELGTSHGLIEWFLGQEGGTVSGYTNAIFSGLTTNALSDVIATIITDYPRMRGVWHVASEPISKYDLLKLVKTVYNLSIEIQPDNSVVIDRSLNGNKLRENTNIIIPSWQTMIEQMHQDPTPYATMRSKKC